MNGHDERLLDSVAGYALGTLPAAETESVRAHIAQCDICRAEFALLAPAVTALGYSAEACADGSQGPMPSRLLKSRVMKAVRTEGRARTAAAVDGATAAMRRSRPIVWPAYAVAAVAILIALPTLIWNVLLNDELKTQQTQIAQLSNHGSSLSRTLAYQRVMLADLVAGDSVRYQVAGGQVIKHGTRLYIALDSMPMPPRGKVYQAWTLRTGAKTMAPSVTFMPNRNGVAVISLLYGVFAGLFANASIALSGKAAGLNPLLFPVSATVIFFVVFRATFAYFWNRRVDRLAGSRERAV